MEQHDQGITTELFVCRFLIETFDKCGLSCEQGDQPSITFYKPTIDTKSTFAHIWQKIININNWNIKILWKIRNISHKIMKISSLTEGKPAGHMTILGFPATFSPLKFANIGTCLKYSQTSIERASLIRRFWYNAVGAWLTLLSPWQLLQKAQYLRHRRKTGTIFSLRVSQGHLSLPFQSVQSFCVLCKWKSSLAMI